MKNLTCMSRNFKVATCPTASFGRVRPYIDVSVESSRRNKYKGYIMSEFTDEQINRYSRHIILPEVGGKGQKKLLDAKVFLVGAGG